MTTLYRAGQFWVIDAVTGRAIETLPPFDTFAAAKDAIGPAWDNGDALYPDFDL